MGESIAEIVSEIIDNKALLVVSLLVIGHISFMTLRSILGYLREKRQLAEMKHVLETSEERLQASLRQMEVDRKAMTQEMQAYQDEVQAANRQASGQTSREANDG
jgi:outer membrane murein-binding lipoprotein Lpp